MGEDANKRMIDELDEALRQLILDRGRFDENTVAISFEQPTGDWAAGLTRPTINCYLYDIRENLELRSAEWLVEQDDQGHASRRLAPKRYDLSYLITVWTQNQVADEHAIFWRVLGALGPLGQFPEEYLSDGLKAQRYPIKARAAQPTRAIQNLPDLWSVMENPLRPSINYVVTLAIEHDIAFTSTLVVSKRVDIVSKTDPAQPPERLLQFGGIVYREDDERQHVSGARITMLTTGRSTVSDAHGRYSFANVPAGEHHLRVEFDGHSVEREIDLPLDPEQDGRRHDLAV